ncbi:hypothetical protein Tco_1333557 [Tanacetum coccineum]
MLVQADDKEQQQSPSRITSTPSLSQQSTPSSPSPEPIQPTHEAEKTASMPHDLPLHVVHSHGRLMDWRKKTYSTALTKLVLRVKKLEYKLKSSKARRKAKIVLFDDEEIAEDSSKQGRKISQIDEDPIISLVQDKGISWIPQEEEVHEKPSDETEVIVLEETPTKIIEEHGSGEKGEMEFSTASPPKVTKVSTAKAHVYTRRSAKDKGKAIMEEPATPNKEAKALQEEEEERLNLEAARELQRQLDQRHEVLTQPTQSQGIDWNDPSVLRSEVKRDSSKPSEKETSKAMEEEKVEEEEVNPEQDDDIWKNQNQWKLISWKLYETCGVHTLMVDGTLMTIHTFVEKKYPLTEETLQKMLNWKLEAEAESSMAFELLKFIKTQIEEQ